MSSTAPGEVGTAAVDDSIPSTGERFIPGLGGAIELEHMHRYVFARQACGGEVVLDIACGEGYGSSMLAQVARNVIGVDIAPDAIAHARKRYSASNIRFLVGSCADIPLSDASVDVVVSFETIEHHDQHEEMMREIRRVLKPGGRLILSSPERFEYSERPGTNNPFHVHELYRDEFIDLVGRFFANVQIYDQKVLFGSAILSEAQASPAISLHADSPHEQARGLVRPVYLIAVASDGAIPVLDTGVFEQELSKTSEWKWWVDTVGERDAAIRRLDAKAVELQQKLDHQQQAGSTETSTALGHWSALAAALNGITSQGDLARHQREEVFAQVVELQRRVIQSQDALTAQRVALEQEFAVRREEVAAYFRQQDAEREAATAAREQALRREFDAARSALEARLSSETGTVGQLRQRLAELGTDLARKTEDNVHAAARIARLDSEQNALHAEVVAREARLTALQAEMGQVQARLDRTLDHVTALAAELAAEQAGRAAIHRSNSWRLTEPLRRAKDGYRALARRSRRAAARCIGPVRLAYRAVPIDGTIKSGVKDAFFRAFEFALRDTGIYRNWVLFNQQRSLQVVAQVAFAPVATAPADPAPQVPEPAEQPDLTTAEPEPIADSEFDATITPAIAVAIPQLAEEVTVMTEPPSLAPTYSAAGEPLWVADGEREWTDLPLLRARIAALQAARLQAVVPRPVAMLSASGTDYRTFATQLRLARQEHPRVTVLVPVFNQIELTLECLASLAQARSEVPFEVLVADDASTDESAEILGLVENIKLHTNTDNLHFLRNCNAALPLASGDYVVFLNNDVQVQDWWLDELLLAFSRYDRVGAVGPKIVYPSGHLQEAGVAFNTDMTVDLIGLGDDPDLPGYNYARRVDYSSGACLMVPRDLLTELGGFCDDFAPAYCEDGDLCLRIRERGLFVYYAPQATVVHRLSATTSADGIEGKKRLIASNLVTFSNKWQARVEEQADVRTIAFYLPQYYPFPENDHWWGKGFTEWTNVTKAQPNFVGHYQPHLPADLGYYDLRVARTMEDQAALARRYGLGGFCFYYYWFAGKRLLDLPVERLLETGKPEFPFCLCWANENWTRRWDGQENQVLMAQSHSDADDEAVILDLIRYFRSPNYIRIDDRPLLLIYRVTLFPDFAKTAAHWRAVCRAKGIGEIYIAMVESFELVAANAHPSQYGCDATVEFPPQGMAEQVPISGHLLNPDFVGSSVDYRTLALRYCNRPAPGYTRFRGAMPGWDNTPRRQNNSYCIEHATPGGFQAWLEHIVDDARKQHFGDERIVFVNAWNEWAEGAHLEPDRRFGHTYLEALKNAQDRQSLLRMQRYAL